VLLRKIILSLCLIYLLSANGQAWGQRQAGRVYEFLNLPQTAVITSMGGYGFPSLVPDTGMSLMIPSLLSQDHNNYLSLNFVSYFDDINYGTVAFTHHMEGLGHFAGSVQYINYGRFIEANELGHVTGEFTAGEYSFQLGWGRMLNEQFAIGSNLKVIYSSFYEYSSLGLATDVSVSYHNAEHLVAASVVARNIGRQITTYHEGNRESLPFDLVLGVTKKLANAPFQFSLVAHNLHHFDLSYDSPLLLPDHFDGGETNGSFQERAGDVAGNVMRHIILGVEFTPIENFALRAGYNYRRRQEMKVDTRLSTVGFSWGFGLRVSRFQINYGRSHHHLAGASDSGLSAPNHISVSTSLQELFSRPDTSKQ